MRCAPLPLPPLPPAARTRCVRIRRCTALIAVIALRYADAPPLEALLLLGVGDDLELPQSPTPAGEGGGSDKEEAVIKSPKTDEGEVVVKVAVAEEEIKKVHERVDHMQLDTVRKDDFDQLQLIVT